MVFLRLQAVVTEAITEDPITEGTGITVVTAQDIMVDITVNTDITGTTEATDVITEATEDTVTTGATIESITCKKMSEM